MHPTLFDGAKQTVSEALELTAASLNTFGAAHRHWAVTWSGGKDSSALWTVVQHLIDAGRVPRPETLTVCYADTRMELTPLAVAAASMIDQARRRGIDVRTVLPPIDDRLFVYMFGRGVPPPSNTFRWCTGQIKVEPMQAELNRLHGERGEKLLVLTGVRLGESAARDDRIAIGCGKDGAECGQGWYQEALPDSLCATLAPLLHWRVCNVWEWLRIFAPAQRYGGWATAMIADAYGGDEAEEVNARTGCVGCALASRDLALDTVLRNPEWAYLAPLKGLKPLYRELKLPVNRLRKAGGETRKDGTLVKNQHRMGPLTMEARHMGMVRVLDIQDAVNQAAHVLGRPSIDILNAEEVARIEELIAANTWPRKWSGDEPRADEPFTEAGERLLFGG